MSILETERTIVDYVRPDDAAFFLELLNSPDWLRFIGDRNVTNIDEALDYLRNGFLRCYDQNGFGYYIVRLKLTFDPIGICGFLKKPDLDNPDFGFAFLPSYYGQGLALESTGAVLDFGIRTFQFSVLDAVTTLDNVRSKRLLEKLAFEDSGTGAPGNGGLRLFQWHLVK